MGVSLKKRCETNPGFAWEQAGKKGKRRGTGSLVLMRRWECAGTEREKGANPGEEKWRGGNEWRDGAASPSFNQNLFTVRFLFD